MQVQNAEFHYVGGQARPTFPALLSAFEVQAARALDSHPWQLDLPYGPHARQTFDFCAASGPARAVVLYLHAGYWQSRDKAQFRFLAPALSDAGFHVAMINYPLCPDVSLSELTRAVQAALPAVLALKALRGQGLPVIAAGHSAGAHLCVELALAQDAATPKAERIRGIVPISGIYDLAPLVDTSLNERLRLDLTQARACSPLYRARTGLPPAVFMVGGDETGDFLWQSQQMAQAWSTAGNEGRYLPVAGCDHFSVLQALQAVDGPLLHALRGFVPDTVA